MALEAAAFTGDRLSRRSFRRLLQRPSAEFLVVAEAGGVVGYVLTLFRRGSRTARIYSLAVRSDRQGQGLGRRLMQAAARRARARGCARLSLEVRADNPAGERLYHRLGFTLREHLPSYYADGAAGLRFAMDLEPSR